MATILEQLTEQEISTNYNGNCPKTPFRIEKGRYIKSFGTRNQAIQFIKNKKLKAIARKLGTAWSVFEAKIVLK